MSDRPASRRAKRLLRENPNPRKEIRTMNGQPEVVVPNLSMEEKAGIRYTPSEAPDKGTCSNCKFWVRNSVGEFVRAVNNNQVAWIPIDQAQQIALKAGQIMNRSLMVIIAMSQCAEGPNHVLTPAKHWCHRHQPRIDS